VPLARRLYAGSAEASDRALPVTFALAAAVPPLRRRGDATATRAMLAKFGSSFSYTLPIGFDFDLRCVSAETAQRSEWPQGSNPRFGKSKLSGDLLHFRLIHRQHDLRRRVAYHIE
jgi:hypothetical protein